MCIFVAFLSHEISSILQSPPRKIIYVSVINMIKKLTLSDTIFGNN